MDDSHQAARCFGKRLLSAAVLDRQWLQRALAAPALGGHSLMPAELQCACRGAHSRRCSRGFAGRARGHRRRLGGVSASADSPVLLAGCNPNGVGLVVSPSLRSSGDLQCGQSGPDPTLSTRSAAAALGWSRSGKINRTLDPEGSRTAGSRTPARCTAELCGFDQQAPGIRGKPRRALPARQHARDAGCVLRCASGGLARQVRLHGWPRAASGVRGS